MQTLNSIYYTLVLITRQVFINSHTYNTHRWLCNNISFTNQIYLIAIIDRMQKSAFSVASHVNKKANSNSVYFALNWAL